MGRVSPEYNICHAEYWTAWAPGSSFQIQLALIFVSFDTAELWRPLSIFVLFRIYPLLLFDFTLPFTLNHYFNPWGLQWRTLFLTSQNQNWIISNSLLRGISKGVGTEKKGERVGHGQGDRWTQALTELKGRQAEGPVLRTSFFLNELYRGNARKFTVLHIFNNLL